MAIKNSKGEKRSPKQLAKELVIAAVQELAASGAPGDEDRTEKEDQLVDEQVKKITGRVLKVLGSSEE